MHSVSGLLLSISSKSCPRYEGNGGIQLAGSFAKYMLQLLKIWEQGESVFPVSSILRKMRCPPFCGSKEPRAVTEHQLKERLAKSVSKIGMFETPSLGTEVVGGCREEA